MVKALLFTFGVPMVIFKPLPPPLMSFAIAGMLEHTVRVQKFVADISPDLSSVYLFEQQADLILALLRPDTPRQSVPMRRSKKRLPRKKRKKLKK